VTAIDSRTAATWLLSKHTGLTTSTEHGKDTPQRFVNALEEMTKCRDCNGSCMKWKTFPAESDQMIIVKDIPFVSVCNHHVLPFIGKAHIGYIPVYEENPQGVVSVVRGRIAGLSKFARVVHHFARRLQVQESLGREIKDFLIENLAPEGLAIVLQAEHTCMTIRGVQAPGTYTTTSIMCGAFSNHERTAKAEFMQHLNGSLL
jgi:GTP cyclohydrolase IA